MRASPSPPANLTLTLTLALAVSGCFSTYEDVELQDTSTSGLSSSAEIEPSSSTTSVEPSSTTSPLDTTTEGPLDPETAVTTGTTGDPGCTSPDGTLDESCADATPYCQAGACVSCTALPLSHCAALSLATPYCDPMLGVCSACSAHVQCPSSACRLATGECFPVDQLLWVDGDDPRCSTGDGSPLAPLCTIGEALGVVATRPAGEAWTVRIASQVEPYVGTLTAAGGRPLALVGSLGNQRPRIVGDGDATLDLLVPNVELYLHGVHLEYGGMGAQTVRCGFGNALWLSHVNVDDGPALLLANCGVTIESSTVSGGDIHVGPGSGSLEVIDSLIEQGPGDELLVRADMQLHHSQIRRLAAGDGIRLDDVTAHLIVDNSIIQSDGDDSVLLVDTGRVDAAFSTFVGGVDCTSPGPSTIRSSIVTGLDCGSLAVDHSLVDAGLAQGRGNLLLPPAAFPTLFVDPAGATGDYHVLPDSLAKDVATWTSGDATVDIDGDARAGRVGAPDYAGADVP